MTQSFIKALLTAITITALSCAILFSNTVFASENLTLPKYSSHFSDESDPFQDATAAIALAQQTNRQVLIEIGGNWCTWCHKLDAFLEENPDIKTKLHDSFVLLKVNVSDVNENQKFMASLPPVLGYPHMYVSDKNGKLLLSKDTAELQEDGEYSRQQFLSFIKNWQVKS